MTPTPEPGPAAPVSPLDLPRLVDEMEERTAAEVGSDAGDDARSEVDQDDRREDLSADVPGAPEPPD